MRRAFVALLASTLCIVLVRLCVRLLTLDTRPVAVYYINCCGDGARDRRLREWFAAQRLGVPLVRIEGVTLRGHDHRPPHGLSAGYRGLYLSLLKAYRTVANQTEGWYALLEDDAAGSLRDAFRRLSALRAAAPCVFAVNMPPPDCAPPAHCEGGRMEEGGGGGDGRTTWAALRSASPRLKTRTTAYLLTPAGAALLADAMEVWLHSRVAGDKALEYSAIPPFPWPWLPAAWLARAVRSFASERTRMPTRPWPWLAGCAWTMPGVMDRADPPGRKESAVALWDRKAAAQPHALNSSLSRRSGRTRPRPTDGPGR